MTHPGQLRLTLPAGLEGKYLTFLREERYTEMAWLGGFGTAKTDCIVTGIIKDAYDYPGAVLVLLRDELVNLKRTTLADLLAKAPGLTAHHNRTESIVTFHPVKCADGTTRQTTLYCFGAMTGDYKQKLKSLQPFRIYIDEADKLHEEIIDMCVLRIRQKIRHATTGQLGKNQIKLVANDEGNNWLWRRFVGKPHPGMAMTPAWASEHVGIKEDVFQPTGTHEVMVGDIALYDGVRRLVEGVSEEGVQLAGLAESVSAVRCRIIGQRFCLYAFTHENKSLNQQNVGNARFVSDAMRRQYILGQVDTQSGLLLPEFNGVMHVIDDMPIPSEWRVTVGIDHGYSDPTAAVFLARDPYGTLFVFADYEQTHAGVPENAENMLEIIGGRHDHVRWVGDTQLWNVDPRSPGDTMAGDYVQAGVRPLVRANKQRQLSVDRLKGLLTFKQGLHQAAPEARLYFMRSATKLIKRIDSITWDDFRASRNDHLIDALRYAVMDVSHARSLEPPKVVRRPIQLGGGQAT